VVGVGELVMDTREVFVFQPGEQGDLAVEGVGDLDFSCALREDMLIALMAMSLP